MNKHKQALVFAATIKEAEKLHSLIPNSAVVTSDTPKKEREKIVSDFRNKKLKVLINCQIFTVGFDYPQLDCIILARPTRSVRLHCQILGRGTRKADGKTLCDIIDYVGNVRNIGKLESIKVEKVENLWDITSDRWPEGMHMKPLFTFRIKTN